MLLMPHRVGAGRKAPSLRSGRRRAVMVGRSPAAGDIPYLNSANSQAATNTSIKSRRRLKSRLPSGDESHRDDEQNNRDP